MLRQISLACLLLVSCIIHADEINVSLSVWANKAIISVYNYNYNNIVERNKETAKLFTPAAWINYSQAFAKSGILDAVKKNYYQVRAVATLPPKIIKRSSKNGVNRYLIVMPVLVTYSNPQYQQKQRLAITLQVDASNNDNDFIIQSFVSKVLAKQQCQPIDLQPTIIKAPVDNKDKKPQKK